MSSCNEGRWDARTALVLVKGMARKIKQTKTQINKQTNNAHFILFIFSAR
jgi:hypothetical protein